jgi:hypothetical protein
MHDFFEKAPDPLDELLSPPAAPADERLRRDLLARTVGVLRRRRRLRRLGLALALAACYAAGLLSMRWAAHPADVPRPEPVAGHPSDPVEDPSALAREWEEVKRRRAELYREAGDLYLTAHDDPESAARCYGEALDAGKDHDGTISPSDSWLLMAIKSARQKEKDDANKSS